MHDSFDIRQHYQSRRSFVIAAMLATRCYNGPQTSTSTQKQESQNAQSTVGDVGAGSVAVSTGAYGTSTINVAQEDPALVAAISGAEETAIQQNSAVAATALNAGAANVAAALGFGKEVVDTSNNTLNNVVTQLATVAAAGQEEAQSAAFQAQLEAGQVSNDLAQIVANTVPQSAGAESELLNGTTPIQPQSVVQPGISDSSLNRWETWAVIAASAASVYVLFFKKKSP